MAIAYKRQGTPSETAPSPNNQRALEGRCEAGLPDLTGIQNVREFADFSFAGRLAGFEVQLGPVPSRHPKTRRRTRDTPGEKPDSWYRTPPLFVKLCQWSPGTSAGAYKAVNLDAHEWVCFLRYKSRISTPAVTSATSGCLCCGMPGVV